MSTNYILFNSRDEMLRLDVRNIVYFEADGNYTSVVLANKLRCSVGMNLGQMQKTLVDQMGDTSFSRSTRSSRNWCSAIPNISMRR